MVQTWSQTLSQVLEVRQDDEIIALPADRPLWLLGWDNRFLAAVNTAWTAYGVELTPEGVRLPGTAVLTRAQDSVVLTARHPQNPQMTLAWVATQNLAALPGLSRKIPHYGTYSFLGVTGAEPINTAKGQWPVLASPLAVLVGPSTETSRQSTPGKLAPRRALVPLP
jgi:hypothetical protein